MTTRYRGRIVRDWSQADDRELLRAHAAGDPHAFAVLVQRYQPVLQRMMRRGISRAQDAEDLVQQTLLQVHRARHDFDPSRAVRPWLFTIAFNLKREFFRRHKRRPESTLEVDVGTSEEAGAEHQLASAQGAAALRRALAELPDNQREVIELHWFEGLSFPEVAEVVGANLSAVKVRAHRGYKILREKLEHSAAPVMMPEGEVET